MAEPTEKAPEIDEVIKEVLGINRIEAIKSDTCAICKSDAKEFRNDISRKEYRISGMCQECQDSVFGKD